MTQQFTASEVRELAATIWPDLSGREEVSETLNAFADLLEARERAMPVVTRESAINAIEHVGRYNGPGRETEARQMLVEGSPSIADPDPSDAKRLAEAVREQAAKWMGSMYFGMSDEDEQAVLKTCANDVNKILAAHYAQAQPPAARVTDIDTMVNRFLSWRLPQDFAPDAGISFKPMPDEYMPHCWPTGTNLFHAGQVKEMILHMLAAQENPNG